MNNTIGTFDEYINRHKQLRLHICETRTDIVFAILNGLKYTALELENAAHKLIMEYNDSSEEVCKIWCAQVFTENDENKLIALVSLPGEVMRISKVKGVGYHLGLQFRSALPLGISFLRTKPIFPRIQQRLLCLCTYWLKQNIFETDYCNDWILKILRGFNQIMGPSEIAGVAVN